METIVTLTITLDGVRPPIWRRLEVPASNHLGELHSTLNAAMGWADYHLHKFEVGDRTYGVPDLDFFPADDKTLPEENVVLGDLVRAGVEASSTTTTSATTGAAVSSSRDSALASMASSTRAAPTVAAPLLRRTAAVYGASRSSGGPWPTRGTPSTTT